MNDDVGETIDTEEDSDFELTDFEERHFNETLQERMSAPVTVSISSADDGFDIVYAGQLIADDRGTASGHDIEIDLFDLTQKKYLNAQVNQDEGTARIWRRVLRRIGAGKPVDLEVRCWNAGGPSQVTFNVSASGSNSFGGREEGTNNGGITFVAKYELRFDRILRKNYIVLVSENRM